MFLFRVLDLVVADPVQALHEHHDRRHAGARHFGCIVQRAGGQTMRSAADLANRFVATIDQLLIERPRLDLPEPLPANGDAPFLRESCACLARFLQHLRQRPTIEMTLIERNPAFLDHAGHDSRFR